MKELKDNLKSIAAYQTADTTNAENFPAWTLSDAARLEQLAMTGTLGSSFYANARETAAEAVALLERADAAALAGAIVRGRNEGFIRTFPILGLVYLSKKDAPLFKATFPQVILTGNDLVDFIEVTKTMRGFGRAVKAAMAAWIAKNTTPYYAQKYRKQIADAIRLSRFKGEDSIFAYVLKAYEGVKGTTDAKLEQAYADYPDLAAQRDFIRAIEANDLGVAARILEASNLDVNALTAYYDKFDKPLWALVAKRSPVMRFVKYLAKFLREGVVAEELLKAKVNVEALKKAKVFPFRLYTAYVALRDEVEAKDRWVLDELAKVLNDYALAFDWSVFKGKRWVVAPDISGSMGWRMGGSSVLTYAGVSAMFVGFFLKGIDRVTVLPWDTGVKSYRVPQVDSVMTHLEAISKMVGGGTRMEASVEYMLRKNVETDYAVFLTDTEEYGRGWLASWKAYHARHPNAVAFVLRSDQYVTSPIDERTAEALNVYQIFGWNDTVLDYMKFIIVSREKAA